MMFLILGADTSLSYGYKAKSARKSNAQSYGKQKIDTSKRKNTHC